MTHSWKVFATSERQQPPFVLVRDGQIVKSVFDFLHLLHLRGMSAKTTRAYAYDLLAFHRFVNKTGPLRNCDQAISEKTFPSQQITEFLLSQRQENAAPRTINRRLKVVRSFLNHLKEGWGDRLFGQTGSSFYKGQRNRALLGPLRIKGKRRSLTVKVPGILISPLTPAEIKKFLPGLRRYRDQAIVHLMIFCGLRSCEVLSLETHDINLIDDQIRVRGKGQKERILPLSSGVRKALMHYLDYERPDCAHSQCFVSLKGQNRGQPMTPEGLRKLFRHQRKKSGLKKAHAHLLRHTFATSLIREKVSLPVVQKLMGHSDITVTMGYVHTSLDDVSREYHQALTSLQKSCETH